MAQVLNKAQDQAINANLLAAGGHAIVGETTTHKALATKLLSDEVTRGGVPGGGL
jgi:hypothetical protein